VGVVFSEDLHDAAAIVAVLREGQEFEAVEHESSMEDWRWVERLRCGALLRSEPRRLGQSFEGRPGRAEN
jgi:hypothetical protein